MAARVAGYEVDALFPSEKVIVELDSWGFHSSRESFESDRERDASTLAASHVTVRLTWERMHRRGAIEAARLQQILRDRRPRAA
jgi:very-short-patch-repair endonuclease